MSDEKEIRVVDRRSSSMDPDGAREPEEVEQAAPQGDAGQGPSDQESGGRGVGGRGALPPEMDFSTFIMSLATSAYIQLGRATPPDGESAEVNLPLAKQTIDILGMLEDKTKGNLTDEEAALLRQILFDLRLQFVDVSQSRKS